MKYRYRCAARDFTGADSKLFVGVGETEEQQHDSLQRSTFPGEAGAEQEFLDAHNKVERNWEGLQHVNIVKTGDRTYCIIAEWSDMDALAAARPQMIATLDTFRDTLEDLGSGCVQNRRVSPREMAERLQLETILATGACPCEMDRT